MPALEPSEKEIQNSVLDYLAILPDCMAWMNHSTAIFDPATKSFRRPSRYFRKGTSDVLGIYKGKPLAIEIKSKIGRLTKEQKDFIEEFKRHGGIAFMARSLEDVIQVLDAV